jgi:hypothetical protein
MRSAVEEPFCFKCGKPGHWGRHCPNPTDVVTDNFGDPLPRPGPPQCRGDLVPFSYTPPPAAAVNPDAGSEEKLPGLERPGAVASGIGFFEQLGVGNKRDQASTPTAHSSTDSPIIRSPGRKRPARQPCGGSSSGRGSPGNGDDAGK